MSRAKQTWPEPVLFLLLAEHAMRAHRERCGQYAGEWHQLGMTFANGPYHVTDAGIRPTRDHGNRWRPKDCEFTYVIRRADQSDYLVEAVNDAGVVEYEMTPGLAEPRKVLPRLPID